MSSRNMTVPDDCPYDICHLMEKRPYGGVFQAPRRSGKTMELSQWLHLLTSAGFSTVVVYPFSAMKKYIIDQFDMPENKLVLESRFEEKMRGYPAHAILSDEASDTIIERAERMGHEFILGYKS